MSWALPALPETDSTTPALDIDEGVATITLNRPARRNRLEDRDLKALLEILPGLNADESIRVVVLRANTAGHPRPVFSAGYNLVAFGEDGDPHLFERVPDMVAGLRPLTVCALNGSIYGGTTDVALACDVRLALEGIEWRMPASALGLHYYPNGLKRYVQCFGPAATRRAFLTARPFSAERLLQLGLLEEVVPVAGFEAALAKLVNELRLLAPWAAQHAKKSIWEISEGDFDFARLRMRERQSMQTDDFAEGRRSFVERRAPLFTGR